MTTSKIPNWPAVKVPIMTHLAAKPCVANLTIPVSAMMLLKRDIIDPVPPAPALLILDNNVSAGWEMIAAETPAITPEPKETDKFSELVHSLFVLPMAL